MHVLPNVRILQNLLSGDESAVARMNIPEYLVYASKRHCNYKAIVTAIQQACDDVDIKFYMVNKKNQIQFQQIIVYPLFCSFFFIEGAKWFTGDSEHSLSNDSG